MGGEGGWLLEGTVLPPVQVAIVVVSTGRMGRRTPALAIALFRLAEAEEKHKSVLERQKDPLEHW